METSETFPRNPGTLHYLSFRVDLRFASRAEYGRGHTR